MLSHGSGRQGAGPVLIFASMADAGLLAGSHGLDGARAQAIDQAHFWRYLEIADCCRYPIARLWCFLGDGECDEPESLGAIALGRREKLDNLIFVVNCNLQHLDGPVRGNGKIIKELEGQFRGAG